jgi:hypothetical protein
MLQFSKNITFAADLAEDSARLVLQVHVAWTNYLVRIDFYGCRWNALHVCK